MKFLAPTLLVMPLALLSCARSEDASSPRGSGSAAETDTAEKSKVASPTKIRLTLGEKSVVATLSDNATTKGFVALLPLTVKMNDLFGREKYGPLPKPLSTGGKRSYTYEVGQIGYWSPGPELAIYYKQDAQRIPEPGILVIGKIDQGQSKLFDVPGSVTVSIEKLNAKSAN